MFIKSTISSISQKENYYQCTIHSCCIVDVLPQKHYKILMHTCMIVSPLFSLTLCSLSLFLPLCFFFTHDQAQEQAFEWLSTSGNWTVSSQFKHLTVSMKGWSLVINIAFIQFSSSSLEEAASKCCFWSCYFPLWWAK